MLDWTDQLDQSVALDDPLYHIPPTMIKPKMAITWDSNLLLLNPFAAAPPPPACNRVVMDCLTVLGPGPGRALSSSSVDPVKGTWTPNTRIPGPLSDGEARGEALVMEIMGVEREEVEGEGMLG